jgi:hypothetical protein
MGAPRMQLPLIYNLLIKHTSCIRLIHNTSTFGMSRYRESMRREKERETVLLLAAEADRSNTHIAPDERPQWRCNRAL